MAVPLSLSLQAFPPVDNDKQSLQYLISRINDQKGSFRNVSEQSLEDEIQVTENNQAVKDQEDVIETFEGAEAAIIKVEEVSSVREEVIRQILLAHNESVQALDFVSLLLSGKVPAVAQTTITPYIRQSLPLGSLGGEAVQTLQSPEVDEHNQGMELIGWRMQSLNGAADSLLKAASRLEEEIAKETTYWSQVLAVNEKGWSLSRLPKEQHTLGVRYGFAEAYADFRDRGLAALRRNEDGSIHIDRGARSKDSSRLRVRILENGKPIGSSVQSFSDALGDQPLEQEMLDARNSIFDEELHHELHQEARDLVNQGVRCVDSRVLLPYEIDKQIEIDIIPVMDENSSESYDKSTLADIVAISLRILIAHAHCQSLRKRSQVPPPLREHQVPRPIYNLLKPVIEWLHHKSQVQALQNMLESLQKLLSAAGLNFSFDLLGQSGHGPVTLDTATQKTVLSSTIDILLQTLTSPHYTKIRLWLLDEQMALTIDVHTALQRYGVFLLIAPVVPFLFGVPGLVGAGITGHNMRKHREQENLAFAQQSGALDAFAKRWNKEYFEPLGLHVRIEAPNMPTYNTLEEMDVTSTKLFKYREKHGTTSPKLVQGQSRVR
ncbi:hypothetical protein P7C71_g3439, partial [Lecanoromycetidae sp. Uapishka_2]